MLMDLRLGYCLAPREHFSVHGLPQICLFICLLTHPLPEPGHSQTLLLLSIFVVNGVKEVTTVDLAEIKARQQES